MLAELGATEAQVARLLLAGRSTVDELTLALGLPVATILGTLTVLEMRGLAISAYGRYRPAGALVAAA
jgi:predicted ArsR family transcriptional regulator